MLRGCCVAVKGERGGDLSKKRRVRSYTGDGALMGFGSIAMTPVAVETRSRVQDSLKRCVSAQVEGSRFPSLSNSISG